ncbi:hypothetical protein PHYC_00149 [Phycisphaerales bacterium]|nr:hypothetical protein PHYC_00149 [Phycisphaerales bacterium]
MKFRFAAVALMIAAGTVAQGAITIVVKPSSAPNAFGSPSWGGYAANALSGLQSGAASVGDRNTDPTGYATFANGSFIAPGDVMVTSFPSWRGAANPLAPFSSELGNRMHFGLHASGDGTTLFTLNDVGFNMSSSDDDNALGFVGNLAGTTYNGTTRIGVNWGANRAPGGGDDIVYNSGEAGTLLIDELFYVGVGNAFWPGASDPDPSNPVLGRQGALDDTAAWFAQEYPFSVTTVYTIFGDSGTGSVSVTPAPGGLALLGLGGLVVSRRRR